MPSQPVARRGDPISYGGQIVEGSPNVEANGIPVARDGDKALCTVVGSRSRMCLRPGQ
jgi:uncharacterized Zn-binding protein involved in type VI secretion